MAVVLKNLTANARDAEDTGLIPGSGRSPGGGNGNPLHYSCLENIMDRRACLLSMGLSRIGHDCSDLANAHMKSTYGHTMQNA